MLDPLKSLAVDAFDLKKMGHFFDFCYWQVPHVAVTEQL
jgi:hypothetical protein